MGNLYNLLMQDIRFNDAIKACMNCGVCTAICPAAEFYDYDPRRICDYVQRKDEKAIEELLRSDTIWYCGQCLSCKTRCPRGNVPAEIILILRKVSQELGYFADSEKGRQQERIVKGVGKNILDIGYCVHPDVLDPDQHPEQGPVWRWYYDNIEDIAPKLGANYHGEGPGALRDIHKKNLEEIRRIFEVTGGIELHDKVLYKNKGL
ncbi:MAG: 4Fe-4S dicluster domain-containing protein [Bacteroidales bacterium]|nr:4Fe-4S dicluster domain-containing protein [Bacteroidales bacterium]